MLAFSPAGKLSVDECNRLGGAMSLQKFVDGQAVVTEGDQGDEFYIIHQGIAEVYKDGKLICPLQRGDFFGETALLQQSTRMASVKAKGDLQCLSLDRETFLKLFGSKRCVNLCLGSPSHAHSDSSLHLF